MVVGLGSSGDPGLGALDRRPSVNPVYRSRSCRQDVLAVLAVSCQSFTIFIDLSCPSDFYDYSMTPCLLRVFFHPV